MMKDFGGMKMGLATEVLKFVLGLAFIIFGMTLMSHGLERMSGGKLERVLESATSTKSRFPIIGRIKGMFVGCGITALMQSSTSTTVITVGFVNSGLMRLEQAVGVIMGANIGTTITLWILALAGLDSELWFVQLLKPSSFAPVIAALGTALLIFSKRDRRRDIGTTLVSFSILMYGMTIMSETCSQLAAVPEIEVALKNIFTVMQNPIIGLLVGAILTAIIHSSAATLGIVQALAASGIIGYSAAIPIILGTNIGTCVTAITSCIGASKNAMRTAIVHLYFNLIGSLVFLGGFYIINAFVDLPFLSQPLTEANIALMHTLFNVSATLLLLPLGGYLAKLATLTIKDKPQKGEPSVAKTTLLDDRFLSTPGFALDQCRTVTDKMALLSKATVENALSVFFDWNEDMAKQIEADEEHLDRYEDKLGTYLVKLSEQSLNKSESNRINQLLHCIGDFERMGDHALNILDSARELKDKRLSFSDEAMSELKVIISALQEILDLAFDSFFESDIQKAGRVEPLEDVIDVLQQELRTRHIGRLQRGECTIQLGFVYSDLLANVERISDHCSNIAVDLIETSQSEFNTHNYLNAIKRTPTEEFSKLVVEYGEKYSLKPLAE